MYISPRNNKQLYAFGWSTILKDFDSKITLASANFISKYQLRQRFNTQRVIDIYGIFITKEEADVLNEEWDSDMPNEQLKEQLDELGAIILIEG